MNAGDIDSACDGDITEFLDLCRALQEDRVCERQA
jgi:hypothetical protein